jgi:hypothetical protein
MDTYTFVSIFRTKGEKHRNCMKVVKLRGMGCIYSLSFLSKWPLARAKWLGDRDSLVAFCTT